MADQPYRRGRGHRGGRRGQRYRGGRGSGRGNSHNSTNNDSSLDSSSEESDTNIFGGSGKHRNTRGSGRRPSSGIRRPNNRGRGTFNSMENDTTRASGATGSTDYRGSFRGQRIQENNGRIRGRGNRGGKSDSYAERDNHERRAVSSTREHETKSRRVPVHWKQRFGFTKLTELRHKLPSDIVFEFSASSDLLAEVLDCTDHSDEMIELLLECLSKACEYTSLAKNVLEILSLLKDSKFFQMTLFRYIANIKKNSDIEDYETAMLYILNICKLIKTRFPSCMFQVIGITTVLGQIISNISDSERTITQKLISTYQHLDDSNEDTMEQMTYETRSDRRLAATEANMQPPQDFHEIPVFPEMHDIHVDIFPFLRKNKVFGGYENLHHYLDVQFRLLREDFIGPLRDGIQNYIQAQKTPSEKWNKTKDIRIYTEVQIISSVCNSSGLCRRVSFSCSGFKRIRWESSKRLLFGSLVCLSTDNFDTLHFATVGNRDLKDLKKGLVDLKFEKGLTDILPEGAEFKMAESYAFFEAYKHVLAGLKQMGEGDLALEKYIVFCETNVQPPAYLRRNPGARYDLRPLVDNEVIIRDKNNDQSRRRQPTYTFSPQSQPASSVSVTNTRRWPDKDLLQLDESQYQAVQMALSKEFVIVQGPPGTGKTYIGLKIVKALLHNRDIWTPDEHSKSPLLVVCYTNHALDQFLEGIIGFYAGDILRLGSRSSSEVMKQHNINSKRLALRRDRKAPIALFRERGKARAYMNSLKMAINTISERIEIAKREVLHEETLQTVIGSGLFRQLMQGHHLLIKEMTAHGLPPPKGKQMSAVLEWLGYGNLTCGKETLQLPSISTTKDVLVENDPEDDDDEEDEFIEAVDEADAEMQNRLMDIFDDDETIDEIDDDGAISQITALLQTIGLDKGTVALDVSNLGTKQGKGSDEWQVDAKQRKRIKKTIRRELSSADKMTQRQVARITNIWKLQQIDRWRLYRYWIFRYCETLHDQIREREEEFQDACDLVNEMQMHEDKEIMRRSTVIGLTTTCAARYQSVLKEIGPRIIVVEEAAEVLEAHVITTLSRHCEHLILIGDHQQLKPNPTVYKLARDYNLEISLFERLIKNNLEYRCLSLQHRMRPQISKVIKLIYPNLADHDYVKSYESIKGISKDVFFIDHTELESNDDDIKSHCNIHEAEYIVALCRYLLLQGYQTHQITVLTLYSAQLFELKHRMPKTNFHGVHLTVVDNYQGEENDIILLSLVRSNTKNILGFVSIENRICVALSRAKKGLYVIGNFGMLERERKNDLWKNIVYLARQENMIGKHLTLYCQNHPTDKGIEAATATDFLKAPEGGCMKPCEKQLRCGHACTKACHVYDKNHTEYVCMKPCKKRVCHLGHICTGICSKPCKKCKVPVSKVIPKCGHNQNVPCSQDPSEWQCQDKCETKLACGHLCQNRCSASHTEDCQFDVVKRWPCGHSATVKCNKKEGKCPKPCKEILECGHPCKGSCGECFYGRLHRSCKKECKRPLVCEHLCKDRCSNCPPCTRKCQNRCVHSVCQKFCGDVCIPCIEPCEWQCEHYSCKELCSEPCKRPRCNAPCKKELKCGHSCIGVCGELCPTVCGICNKDIVKEIFFGSEDEDTALFVQLQDCPHFFEVSGLDKWMDEHIETDDKKTGIKLKECPKCKTPIRRNLRYGNMIKETLKDIEKVKKQIIGDESRIDELYNSIQIGTTKLKLQDRTMLKQEMEKMAKKPVSVQTFATIENQVRFLTELTALVEKYKTEHQQQITIKTGCYTDLTHLHDFIIRERKFFTTQEVTDILDELDRLKLLLQFLRFKAYKSDRKIYLCEDTASIDQIEGYLTDGKKLQEKHKKIVTSFVKRIEKVIPKTGLGITDDEKVQIVQAMDLAKGHWYKCPNGHVYAIGDCGGATVESTCPECKATIGGSSHRLRGDNAVATEMDGATHPAWSEQANMGNYDPFEVRF